jgi:hypothetical protein
VAFTAPGCRGVRVAVAGRPGHPWARCTWTQPGAGVGPRPSKTWAG